MTSLFYRGSEKVTCCSCTVGLLLLLTSACTALSSAWGGDRVNKSTETGPAQEPKT